MKMEYENNNYLVRWFYHTLYFINGFTVRGWTMGKMKRSEAINHLLEIANCNGFADYKKEDIEKYSITIKSTF